MNDRTVLWKISPSGRFSIPPARASTKNRSSLSPRQFDPQPFHLDDEAAQKSPFQGLAASGWHTAAMTMRMMLDGEFKPAGGILGVGFDELSWPRPVRPGDELHAKSEVLEVRPSKSRPDRGMIRVQHDHIQSERRSWCMAFTGNLLVPRRPAGSLNDASADNVRTTFESGSVIGSLIATDEARSEREEKVHDNNACRRKSSAVAIGALFCVSGIWRLACRGRRYHRDRNDRRAQCRRLALVYRPPQEASSPTRELRSTSSTCRPPRAWCSSLPRARSISSATSAWSSRSMPSRKARRSHCCASSARCPPTRCWPSPAIASVKDLKGKTICIGGLSRHQPRLSRAHHAGQRTLKTATTT